jgi:acyl dehydratase
MTLYLEDYEALPPGHRWTSPGRTVGESDIALFGGLTGDLHPLHTDAEVARASGYGERIAQGYLTASLAAGLAYRIGLDEGSSYALLNIGWTFREPVRIGDTIRVHVELTSARPSRSHPGRGVVLRRYEVENQVRAVVAVGEVAMLCNRRPRAEPA